jgi:hypothetical protein
MKTPILSLLILHISLTLLQAQETVVVNDPNARVRDVASFERISVSSAIDLYLSPDDTEKVVVSADDPEARDRIVTRVSNGTLEIYYDCKGAGCWTKNRRLKVYVGFRNLQELKASGATNTYVNGVVRADKLKIGLTGASNFKGAVEAGELVVDQSGASDIRIGGTAKKFRLDLSGASTIKGFELAADFIVADVSGASTAQLNAVKEMEIDASGASDVRYRGAGVLKSINSSGASSVKKG